MQKFNKKKFIDGLTDIKSATDWAKDIVQLFNLRKIIIYIILTTLFAGFWYWRGFRNTEAIIDIGYEDEIIMNAPRNYQYFENLAVHKNKNSNNWNWINSVSKEQYAKVLLKDVPQSAKLRPYGFCSKLIGFYGVGSGLSYIGIEVGIGYRFVRLWSFRTEIIATNKGGYLSASYKVKRFIFENTYLNVGVGKGYKGDDRVILGINVEF